MAQTIQIVVEVDAQGAVKGLQQVKSEAQLLGPVVGAATRTGAAGFDRLATSQEIAGAGTVLVRQEQERLRDSARLSLQLLGVEMPRGISKLIASSTAFQAVAATAFNVAVVAYFAQALVEVGKHIGDLALSAGGYTEAIREAEKAEHELNQQILTHPETLAAARENLDLIIKQRDETQRLGQSLSKESGFYKVILGYAQEIIGLREKDTALAAQQKEILKETTRLEAAEKAALAQMDAQLAESGLQGFNAIRQRVIDLQLAIAKGHTAEIESISADIAAGKTLTDAQKHYLEAGALGQKESAALRRQLNDEAIKLEQAAGAVGLGTLDAIAQKAADEIEDLRRKYKELGAAPTDPTLRRDVGAIQVREAKEAMDARMDLQRKMVEQVAQSEEEAAVASVAPWQRANAQIEVDFENRLRQIDNDEREALKNFGGNAEQRAQIEEAAQERRKNAALGANAKIFDSDRELNQRLREFGQATVESERAAAVALLPPWQRADAQIIASAQDRLDRIEQQERELKEFYRDNADAIAQVEADAQRQRTALWKDANAQIADNWRSTRDKLANDLESLFTGDIGQNILKEVEHFFFKILASWLMTLGDMRQAASEGGLLNAILGGFTGGGGGAGAAGGAGLGGGLGGILRSFFTGDKKQPIVYQAGAGPALPASVQPVLPPSPSDVYGTAPGLEPPAQFSLEQGAATTAGYTGLLTPGYAATGLAGGQFLSSIWPGSTATTAAMAGPGVYSYTGYPEPIGSPLAAAIDLPPLAAGLPSAGVGPPKAATAALDAADAAKGLAGAGIALLGAKLGGTPGSIGGLLSSLGIAAALGSNAAWEILGFLGPEAPLIVGAAGGGLIGFGIGQKYGKLPGAVIGGGAGAGIGAIIGMLSAIGGPIGALIGGAVGLLGGIFGGLLGGAQRRAQAEAYYQKQVEPALAKVLDDYNLHQSDFATTLANLVSLQDQARQALGALKGEGSDVFKNRVQKDIQKDLDQITTTEAERQRRAALTFGPPQFQEGGYIAPELPRTSTGGILAELHPHEFVSTAAATALHRPELEAWNAGAAGQSPALWQQTQQAEEQRRSSATLRSALPQFELGGFVSGQLAGFRLSNGDVMSALQRGASASTTSASRPAPRTVPDIHVHLPIQALDGDSVDRWLRNGGDRKIKAALLRAWREYSGSGPDLG